MRRLLVSLAAAGTSLAFTSPATAQFYPQPNSGYNYGYDSSFGQVRGLGARIDRVQRQIHALAYRGSIRGQSAGHLMDETRMLEWRLRSAARNGLNPYEARDLQQRLAIIEERVRYAADGRYGRRNGGWNGAGYYADRDRDGGNDRYEDDGEWRRD